MDNNSCQQDGTCEIDFDENSAHAVDHDVRDPSVDVLNMEVKKMAVTDTKSEQDASEKTTRSRNLEENFCHSARTLSGQEITKLRRDVNCVSDFKQNKLEREAQKNWDLFYKRNTTKFFKDRHWTKREFDELCPVESETGRRTMLEVGCGVGNFIWPLLHEDDSVFFYACDFSPRAVQFVKDNPDYDPERCCAFQCDITSDDLSVTIPHDSVDVVSMIFVLSAIHPDKMEAALTNIIKVMKPGGSLLFRDYGLYDYAMLRFAPGHKLSENFYVRQDGTRAYYFSTEKLLELVGRCGFDLTQSQCEYVQRDTVNKKEGLCVPRIFTQGRFIKPNPTTNMTANNV
ncbi:tRNA N(3)-methylcytidine methyltransferase METTL6-like isoform X2 [Ostrea edulis]|uniref:tRNA N(3)-methylcytidine methyltransferase METTL6-like isoform X2 n=1 Tax=Ostrea edulis TaxID=37623 RepID=UPI0024AE9377|nr:tRNA N(3)-methylcytidine methyltransferase METTL6-like isoform X2 [Ostrea edulis]